MAVKAEKPIKTRIKVGDNVVVISGKARTQQGEVLAIDKKRGRIFVKGVNLRKKFVKTQENPKGMAVEIEASMNISNVALYDSKVKKGVRISVTVDKNNKKVRVSSATKKELD